MQRLFFFSICFFFGVLCCWTSTGYAAPASRTGAWYTAYYGTTNTSAYNTAPANWEGGTVYLDTGSYKDQLGNVGNQQARALETDEDENKIVVNPDTNYRIKSIQWAEASWSSPGSVTITGSWHAVTGFASKPASDYDFKISGTSGSKKYVVWVVFETTASTRTAGGQVGAWWGTNNVTDYDTPQANGKGGVVKRNDNLVNRKPDGYTRDSDDEKEFEVNPSSGYKIVWIKYGETLTPSSWTTVPLPSDPTDEKKFDINITGGKQYVIWVLFASTSGTEFTVDGAVDPASDSACLPAAITPASRTVNNGSSASFTFSTASSCLVENVTFTSGTNSYVTTAPDISGSTYTTPVITGDSSFTMKFIVRSNLKITAAVAGSSGCGTISPPGDVYVTQSHNQTFAITVNSGCSISHVYVTDPDRPYTNVDLAPLPGNSYTFNNVQANGSITVSFVSSVPAAGNDYCQIPPFVQGQTNLTPNVLIIFDNSGSMGNKKGNAYYGNNKPYNCTAAHNRTNPCPTIFYGYFDPYTMYDNSTNSNVYTISSTTLNMESGGKSGNYLNYFHMDKVDVVRKVLVGGRVTASGSTTLAGSSRGTLAKKFLYTNNQKWVEYGVEEPKGLIQNLAGKVRFGLEVFNRNNDGGTIITKLGAPTGDLVTAVEGPDTDPSTRTPIAEAIYEAIRYFQAKPSAYNNGVNYGDSTWNPSSNPIIQYACQKHFVLLLTDGEANGNNKLPGLSGGTLNSSADPVFDVTAWVDRLAAADLPGSNDGKYVDAVAFYGHNTDLRSTAFGNDITGTQNLTFYSVYAFGDGTGTATLQMMSKYGGYESKNGNDATDPNTAAKYASPDQAKEWDKDGNGVPDTYYEGDDGSQIESGILAAMSSILAKVASGTAASVLSNSEGTGANLLQAVFYPNKIFEQQTEANWLGELQNLWYYIDPYVTNSTVREDTDYAATAPDHLLNLRSDYAASFVFNGSQTTVNLLQDTNGDGVGETTIMTGVDLDNVKSIWRSGKNLWLKSAASRTIYTSTTGLSLLPGGFTDSNKLTLAEYLQAANNDSGAEAGNLISYIRGTDSSTYRNRTVSILTGPSTYTTGVWKLGDIIASTPRMQSSVKLNGYDVDYPAGYGDASYKKFTSSSTYTERGMAYVGANDGMFHAFKLGKLSVTGPGIAGDVKAKLTGSNLGEEQWAYIPRNALPYLKYFTDRSNYNHLYYVDGPIVLADVATGGCVSETDYWRCSKDTSAGSNWRSIVISSMGLGGAAKVKGDSCIDTVSTGTCVKTPIYDPADTGTPKTTGIGYSSYFAFDVTGQYFNSSGTMANAPVFKWEFSHPELGFSTSGAAIVKINTRSVVTNSDGSSSEKADIAKNGKWFAVLASGPTGPIDTSRHQFMGKSNQNLKFFVIDLGATIDSSHPFSLGTNYWILDSGITNAFSGTLAGAVIDADRWNKSSESNYEDDALYVGFTKASAEPITTTTEWSTGGVVRILTKGDADPAHWTVSTVIDAIGPVTTGVSRLQDRKNHNLWLYFGTGRYYFSGDDTSPVRKLIGLKDPCYLATDKLDPLCTTATSLSDLTNQTAGSMSSTVGNQGWYINLDSSDSLYGAERVVTDPVAMVNGAVYFTTFKPTSDICSFGGSSYMWGVGYKSGLALPSSVKQGKALIQLSTGAFEEVNLAEALTEKENRRTAVAMTGKPPSDPPPIISKSNLKPVKRILHVEER